MYLPGFDDAYEKVQDDETPYNELVTTPEKLYLQQISSNIVMELPENFNYIDLGPGTEHKERFIFEAASNAGKNFTYRPVDISDRYLELARIYAEEQGLASKGIRLPFEDVSSNLSAEISNRFVSLGLTYSNYDPVQILSMLKVMANGGQVFINAQIRDRVDLDRLRQIYADVAVPMLAPKLELLGLNINQDMGDVEVTDGIRVWGTVRNINEILEEKGVKSGDKMLLFQSLRPSLEDLEDDVSNQFGEYKMFDTGESFVGVLAK